MIRGDEGGALAHAVDISDHRRSIFRRLKRYALTARRLDSAWLAEWVSERAQLSRERHLLATARASRDVCWTDDGEPQPLVTVRIATYGRPDLLVNRAVRSALAQTYSNIEVLVVGDGCTEDTGEALSVVKDPRLRYVNLGRRTRYPEEDEARWLVAGYEPMNVAIALARGDWLAPCDDDDELMPDHVERLLAAARTRRLELVWSKTAVSLGDDEWAVVGHPRLRQGHITHGSVLYSAGLGFMRYRGSCYRLHEPFDWNLWRRMAAIGVRMGFEDAVTYRYFPSPVTANIYRDRAAKRYRAKAER